jgi:asparagine synthase (glutamine-hydrolysing)
MCGILGYFGNKVTENDFKTSLNLMNHRGPDHTEVISYENVILGHKRLSIIDLSPSSHQPFEIGEYSLIFNGEIYNYIELKRDHSLKTKTNSDTEVLLKMYIKYGHECLKYFNGMFSFIIYNKITKDVFVARDRLGIKPLYIYDKNNEVIFSSEIAPILNLYPSDFDEFGLRQYRKLRMTIKGYTVYKDIKCFPAGFYSINGVLTKYWDIVSEESENPLDDELDYLLRDSIALRKRSDVPVGTFLSGGLDSTILTYVLQPNNTWTVGFSELNEFEWSDIADKSLTSQHHKITVTHDDFLRTGEWMIKKRKEPLSVPNEILIYLMTKSVKKKNTVILSGEGADELFWGYDRIFNWANSIDKIKISEFDEKYCYGSNKDDEVIDFALSDLPGKNPLQKVAYFFQIHHLHGLLRRVDNSTMLCSVEARVPFVDHRLIEMMFRASFDWKMGKSFKEPLKRLYRDIIPKSIINRKKIGFPVPLENIFYKKIDVRTTSMDAWLEYNINLLEQ